ncbi:MAG TPA: AMP-binding protein, partial [Egibacteraceae bacterium]|nr:AMP-binding protein [Egibacteraceae bacterium]
WDDGDAAAPLPADLPEPELARVLAALRPHMLVDERGTTALSEPEPVPAEVVLVVATSGSTGAPKGVQLSAATLEASARAGLSRIQARPGERWLCCLPLHHIGGLQVLVRSRLLGSAPAVHARFDPAAVARESGVTLTALVPTMLGRLLDAGVELSAFRRILVGGGPLPAGLLARAEAAGAHVVQTYGTTETAGGCVYDGLPLDGVDVSLGDGGRIRVKGPVLFSGYRRRPELTAAALRDGWLLTDDLGRWSPDGRLQVLGRCDDVIVTGGRKVAAAEVAGLLAEHPAVAEAAVVGRADPDWGERVVAVVVAAGEPPTLEQLRRFVAQHAAAFKAPRELVVVGTLPRLASGKLDRRALRDLLPGGPAVPGPGIG